MWQDALARADREQKAWPYAWAEAPGYEHADQRGSVSGRLVVRDPQAPGASAAGAWVGLAHPPYEATFEKRRADHHRLADRRQALPVLGAGRRRRAGSPIPNARPGTYTLYAFTDGVLGDFSRADVRVEAGKTTALGRADLDAGALRPAALGDRRPRPQRRGVPPRRPLLAVGALQPLPEGVPERRGLRRRQERLEDGLELRPAARRPTARSGWRKSTWRIRFDLDRAADGHGDPAARHLRRPRRPGRCRGQRPARSAAPGNCPSPA